MPVSPCNANIGVLLLHPRISLYAAFYIISSFFFYDGEAES